MSTTENLERRVRDLEDLLATIIHTLHLFGFPNIAESVVQLREHREKHQ